MFDALYIAATGMQAQQQAVDTIANNLANVSTTGFKKARVSFTDLMTREATRSQALTADPALDAGLVAPAQRLGAGVGTASVGKVFDPGDVKQTGSQFDVAIQGDGFLELTMPDGSRAFTRGGTLKVNADGTLVTASGHLLRPGISVPSNATGVAIQPDGRVRITVPNQATPVDAGQLELVRFANPGALLSEGDNVYRGTDASGAAMSGRAGLDGIGTIAQGYLEGSNVKMIDEMVGLVVAQRAYEASVKIVQASDEMLGMVNSLRR